MTPLPYTAKALSPFIVTCAGILALATITFAETTMPDQKVISVPVITSEDSNKKGILLILPKAISAAHAGKMFEFDYTVFNTLEEEIFFQTDPIDTLSFVYTQPDGSGTSGGRMAMRGHHDRYALLQGSDYRTGERSSNCCTATSRRARIELPEFAKPGGTVTLTIYVHGYFLKNGERFNGKTEVSIAMAE